MPQYEVFRLLVASPGDLEDDRRALEDAVLDWNHLHSEDKGAVLLPVLYEDTAPADARRSPQEVINRHLVAKCDLCVGLFWSRIGTKTRTHPGGAVEEVEQMIENNRPTAIYFCKRKPPNGHDRKQYAAVKRFEKKHHAGRYHHTYERPAELQELVQRTLSAHVEELLEKEAKAARRFSGNWLEIKSGNPRRPYALVKIKAAKGGQHVVRGTSYSAKGDPDVSWPDGKLDVSISLGNRLVHCFDAQHGKSSIIGLSSYEFHNLEANHCQGRGFYAHHSIGGVHTSSRIEFQLEKVTPGLLKRLIGKGRLSTDQDRRNLIGQFHRDLLQERYIVTGGAYSGKTTVIEALEAAGHATLGETAIEVISDRQATMGKGKFKKWRERNPVDFQLEVFRKQRAAEQRFDPGSSKLQLFMDRSAIDCIAYLRLDGLPVPGELWDYARGLRIERVFLLDTLDSFKGRPKTGRRSTKAMSLRVRDLLDEVYRELDHIPIPIRMMSVENRVEAVLKHV